MMYSFYIVSIFITYYLHYTYIYAIMDKAK